MLTELPTSTDVLIVGAGATGLALAATLAARGVSFVVIDALAEPRRFAGGIALTPQTLELLEPLGITERLTGIGNRARAARFFSGDRNREVVALRFDKLSTRFPYLLFIPQQYTEKALTDRLGELAAGTRSGAESAVYRPYKLLSLAQDDTGVTATVLGPDGERTVRAKYAAGTDGVHSTVRELTHVGFPGELFRQSYLQNDVFLTGGPPRDEVHMFCSRLGAVTFAHIPWDPAGVVRIALSLDRPPAAFSTLKPHQLQALIDERAPDGYQVKITEVLETTHHPASHRVAERYRVGRIFLAGDAAHSHSPIGGQAINLGMQDGAALGTALGTVLNTGEDVLDSYENERRPAGREVVDLTRQMNQIATEPNRWKGALRDALFPVARIPVLNQRVTRVMAGLDR
jgi:2-polyprenyl-6-methoxyphenol hydroxylase-like FAD-dependent oxidoreductase